MYVCLRRHTYLDGQIGLKWTLWAMMLMILSSTAKCLDGFAPRQLMHSRPLTISLMLRSTSSIHVTFHAQKPLSGFWFCSNFYKA